MNEEFVKEIYETIVKEGESIYKELYENTEVTERTIAYWKNALELYHSFENVQKSVFMDIIRQTMIDTISSVFGILDGSSTLGDGSFEFDVKINGVDTEDELQDTFLGYVEESLY
ncbi:MAG: hypothetical protein NC124_11475 [Clostridium sp.]|nr:hypothetical protein [Clostridium sp.]